MLKHMLAAVALTAVSLPAFANMVSPPPSTSLLADAAEVVVGVPIDREGRPFANLPGVPFDRSSAYCPYVGSRLENREFGEMVCVRERQP